MRYLMGIDLGTSSVKTSIFSETGKLMASAINEYPLLQPQNGWAEQNPEEWWSATVLSISQVLKTSKIDAEAIAGIGLSGQMHGLVMLDENNKVIRNAIIWCDQRSASECDEITEAVGKDRLFKITANPASTGFTASKLLWVRNHEPENYKRCHHILLPKDYIRFRLTGLYYSDVSDASGTQLLDIEHRCWSEEILNKLNIPLKWLPSLCESPDVTGTVSESAAKITGLSVSTIVVGGAGDNAAAAVGVGAVEDGKAFTTIGTSGVVYAHSSSYIYDHKGRVHTFCSAVPKEWHVMGVTQAAGLSLKWFRDTFCLDIQSKAAQENKDAYEIMDKIVEKKSIGANKLLFLPYLMGERTPHLDPYCRGVFFGLSAIHTRDDMMRAVMEGVTYSLRDCFSIISDLNIVIKSMAACGGGGKSKLWRQMMADNYGCSVNTMENNEGASFGAAILAAVGCGLFNSVQDACRAYIHTVSVTESNDKNAEMYSCIYEVYRSIYPKIKSEFEELNKLNL